VGSREWKKRGGAAQRESLKNEWESTEMMKRESTKRDLREG
jgi:hypothetical protein